MKVSPDMLPGRYKLLGKLGEGGLAVVWRVLDQERGGELALKWLKPGLSPGDAEEAGLRIKREYYFLTGLEHPAFTAVYDLGEASGRPYFTMDIVEGESPADWLQSNTTKADRLHEVWRLGEQLLSVLAYLHARGIVHGDMSPLNLRVTNTKRLHLLDFGLAGGRPRREEPVSMTGGTPHYIAPERIREQGVDGRADLYSAGAVLYELACGRTPFIADNASQLNACHLRESPPPPRELNPGISGPHQLFLFRLLEKRPENRFPGAIEALHALRGCSRRSHSGMVPPIGRPEIHAPFVGNVAALASVRSGLERTGSQPPAALLIQGEAGAGKSRLLQEAGGLATDRGFRILRGATREAGGEPGQIFHDLFVDWSAQETRTGSRRMRIDPELLRHFPELRTLALPSEWPAPLPPEAARARLQAALPVLFRRLASKGPLLLLMEDLHWADELSLSLIDSLIEDLRIPAARIHVICTSRSGGAVRGRLKTVPLKPLRRSEARRLALALAGNSPAPDQLSAWLAESGGNAFLFTELVRARTASGSAPSSRRVTAGVDAAIDRRLMQLPARALPLLRAAALVAPEFPWRWWRMVANTDDAALFTAAEAALRLGLIVEARGRLRFRHDLLRTRLVSSIPSGERRAMHRRIAEALHQSAASDQVPISLIAHHAIDGGLSALACSAGLDAADARIAIRDYAGAKQWLERLQRSILDQDTMSGAVLLRHRMLQIDVSDMLGDARNTLARTRQAIRLAQRLGDARSEQALCWQLGAILRSRDQLHASHAPVARAVMLARKLQDRSTEAKALTGLAFGYFKMGELARAERLFMRVIALSRRDPRAAYSLTAAQFALILLRTRKGDMRGALRTGRECHQRARKGGDLLHIISTAINLGDSLLVSGDLRGAREFIAAARRGVRRCRLPYSFSMLLHLQGQHEMEAGRCKTARAALRDAQRLAALHRYPIIECSTGVLLADLSRRSGRLKDGLRQARIALALARQIRQPSMLAIASATLAQTLIQSGNPGAARRAAVPIRHILRRTRFHEPAAALLGIDLRLAALAGRLPDFRRARVSLKRLRNDHCGLARLRLERDFGEALLLSGRNPEARRLLKAAIRRARRGGFNLLADEMTRLL